MKGIDGFIRFRRALEKLITWRGVFDHFILACILTNCLFLALSDPSASPLYAHDEIWNAVLFVGDLAFTAIFCVEMLLKLLVYGVAFHPKAYLRSVWNWLDMLVVVFSVLRYQLSSTLMLSVIDDDARSYSELSARHAHLLSAGRHLGRAQAAAIIRDAWLRRCTAEPI